MIYLAIVYTWAVALICKFLEIAKKPEPKPRRKP